MGPLTILVPVGLMLFAWGLSKLPDEPDEKEGEKGDKKSDEHDDRGGSRNRDLNSASTSADHNGSGRVKKGDKNVVSRMGSTDLGNRDGSKSRDNRRRQSDTAEANHSAKSVTEKEVENGDGKAEKSGASKSEKSSGGASQKKEKVTEVKTDAVDT